MLLLTRTEARRDEFAMCLALGATRGRLVRGVLSEGALLVLGGAMLALPLCPMLFSGVRTFELPGRVSLELLDLSIDGSAVIGVIAAASAATLIMALVAGAFGFSASVADALRSRMGATPRIGRRRIRRGLVVAQVAVALVLMAGAGLFARSLAEALRLNPDRRTDRLMTGEVSLSAYGYTPARAAAFFDDLFARLGAHGAIADVAQAVRQGGMSTGGRVIVDGQPTQLASFTTYMGVDVNYFETMDLPAIRGRTFGPSDGPGAPPVIVVSESLARAIAPDGNAIGHRITDSSSRPPAGPIVREIVGVVPDVITDVRQLQPLVKYMPIAQADEMSRRTIVLRAAASSDAAGSAVRDVLRALDAGVTAQPMRTIDEQLLAQMGPQRFGMLVMGALGTIAVLLTALGAFVTAELMAAVRRREMGIRAALGARGSHLGALIVRESIQLVGVGLVIGLGLAAAGTEMIRAFLFRVEPLDPVTIVGVAGGLLVLSVAVSLRPALAASRPDLTRLLREE
jgi:predicted permease